MKKMIERNLAEIIILAVFVICFSSCGSVSPHHACGITELNKQYRCNR